MPIFYHNWLNLKKHIRLILTGFLLIFVEAVDAIEAYIKDPGQFDSLLSNNHNRDTDAEFNKLREDNDNDTTIETNATLSPVVASPPSTNKKSAAKRKSVSITSLEILWRVFKFNWVAFFYLGQDKNQASSNKRRTERRCKISSGKT